GVRSAPGASRVSGWSSTIRTLSAMSLAGLSAAVSVPTRVTMDKDGRSALDAFLWGEVLLFGLLAATLALFVAYPGLRPSYGGDDARLVLQRSSCWPERAWPCWPEYGSRSRA